MLQEKESFLNLGKHLLCLTNISYHANAPVYRKNIQSSLLIVGEGTGSNRNIAHVAKQDEALFFSQVLVSKCFYNSPFFSFLEAVQ